MLEPTASLPGACTLSVVHHNSSSIGDGSHDIATPTSTTSGGSTPSRLRRAFLAAASGNKAPTSASVGAWNQIMQRSRQQHKKICYMLLVAIVVLAAVGAGGIAAGAKAKAEHQRGIDAAAAAKAAQRAAAAAAQPIGEVPEPGVVVDSDRLRFGVTINVFTAESQEQACSNWFVDQEQTMLYQDLFMAGYSGALGIPHADITVDDIQCDGSVIPVVTSSSATTASDSSTSSSGNRRSLKQAATFINVTTVFSVPQPPTGQNSKELVDFVLLESNNILSTSLSSFFNARSQVVEVQQISQASSAASPSPVASTAVQTPAATTKQEVPRSIPTPRTTYSSSAAATDLFQAGGQAAAAAGAAQVTPSNAAAGAHHGHVPEQIPLVVVDQDGTVIINEVLLPETSAVNATQVQEFQDAMKSATSSSGNQAEDNVMTIEVQLPPGLAAQHMTDMPDDVIPVTQAAFTAVEPPTATASIPIAAAVEDIDNTTTHAAVVEAPVSAVAEPVMEDIAAEPAVDATAAAAAPAEGAGAAADATIVEETAIVSTPGVDPTAGSSATESSAPAPAIAPIAIAPIETEMAASEPLEVVIPNPSTPVSEFSVVPEDASSNPAATTTFFPEVPVVEEPAQPAPELIVEPETQAVPQTPTSKSDGSPTQEQLQAYDWGAVLLETFDATPVCPFMPLDSNIMADALGRLWSLYNGQSCAFKAPDAARLRADPSATNGAPLPTWETAVDCGEAPTASNSVREASGHVWGWKNGASCAFRESQPAADVADAATPHGPKMDTVWEVAPVCTAAPMKFTAVADAFGRLWGVVDDGRSCAFKYVP